MEPTIFRYVFKHSMRQQIIVLLITAASFPFLYYSLDLPKTIINKAIGGKDFPQSILGYEFQQIGYLFALCGMFLFLVLINGGFKYVINVFKGRIGERIMRRMRYELYSRVLRFPIPRFRKISQGEIVSMITAEVEPLGGFVGDAMALPAFQGGTLLTILIFMFIQEPILGFAAIALYPVQMYLIPKLQKKVNALAKRRIKNLRKVSEHIGETVTGISEIHAHDTSELERAKLSNRLDVIYHIRYEIYRKKFLIKFLNNFIAQVTPFFFYSIGGYLVIKGDLTFGALVAVLAAYKDLSSPWKELLHYYQIMEDTKIKYEQIAEQFQPPGMLDKDLQRLEARNGKSLSGTMVATNLALEEEGGIKVVDGITATLDLNKSTAIVGSEGAGCNKLAQMLARLLTPSAGSITIGERTLDSLPESVIGRRMAYVDQDAGLFSGSVRDNLLYGIKHHPASMIQDKCAEDESEQTPCAQKACASRRKFITEAVASGNTSSDLKADWIDYKAAGVTGQKELTTRVLQVLKLVDLQEDIYELGLLRSFDPQKNTELADSILEARSSLRYRLSNPKLAKLIEPFDRDKYNINMTVGENLLFGSPIGDVFNLENLGESPYVIETLEKVGLSEDFLETAVKLATLMVELFQDLPPGHEFFERFSFINAEELNEFQHSILRINTGTIEDIDPMERQKLISLTFKLTPGRHRLGLIDDQMKQKILNARHAFADNLPDDLKKSVAFFDKDKYNASSSIQDNILFGKLVYGRPQSKREVGGLIREVIESMDLIQAVLDVGLESSVGVSGGRLSSAQRQKLAIARCLLKKPDIMIINAATTALDPASQAAIMDNVFTETEGKGVIWVLNQANQAARFDNAIIMESGKIVEQGSVEELNQPEGLLSIMSASEY